MRLASPQTPEDAEELRQHAAAFVAERFPAPVGPDPAAVGGKAEYDEAGDKLAEGYTRETAAAYGGWSEAVRDRARAVGAPEPGTVEAGAMRERAGTEAGMIVREAGREARAGITEENVAEGRARVAVEVDKPFGEHVAERGPVRRRVARGPTLRHREERRARCSRRGQRGKCRAGRSVRR